MAKQMLVNVTHVEESRVAVLDGGVLTAYEIETTSRTSMRGNIYNAVVESVHTSLEAAFLRIGNDLKGFLPLDEINFRLLPARGDGKGPKIAQHLRPGQKLMVQVIREPFAGKPASVSTYFSLPGRFLVLMPGVDSAGVSRKIEDSKQRDKLKKIVADLKVPEGFGLIVRTAGMGQTKTELQRDLRYLLRLWESIQKSSPAAGFPGLVYREADLVIRTIRDYFTQDINEVWIDSADTYGRALDFLRQVMPTRAKVLKRYEGDQPIFSRFRLEEQIERIYKRRVPLPSGGEIVIDGTEAMTAIDVNSARSRGNADAEENALNTNVEAADEIARQLRLRDLGGLIVIDFIDMMRTANRTKVERQIRAALKGDKAKYDVTKISKLGLMEMARQRIKGEKLAASYRTCPSCDGFGLIKTIEAAGLAAFRKLHTWSSRGTYSAIELYLPIEVATWLQNNKRGELMALERRHELRVEVKVDAALRRHESSMKPTQRTAEEMAARRRRPAAPKQPVPEERDDVAEAREEEKPAAPSRSRRRSTKKTTLAKVEEPSKERPPTERSVRPRPTQEKGAEAAEGEATGDAPSRPRRRRRRRRSDRGDEENRSSRSGDSTEAAPKAARPEGDDETSIPSQIQANELMPAAIGGAEGQQQPRRRSRSRGGTRRKRKPSASRD